MLEGLHDRRLFVDALLKKSVAEMKDSATKTSIRRGLERLDALVRERAKELERYHQDVGACVSSVEVLLLKAMALQQEAATFSGKTLNSFWIAHRNPPFHLLSFPLDTCLGFVGDSDSTEAAATAYSVLETIAAYQRALEHRQAAFDTVRRLVESFTLLDMALISERPFSRGPALFSKTVKMQTISSTTWRPT